MPNVPDSDVADLDVQNPHMQIAMEGATNMTFPGVPSDCSPEQARRDMLSRVDQLPCLAKGGIVKSLLDVLESVSTNGEYLEAIAKIRGKIAKIRAALVGGGAIKSSASPLDSIIPRLLLAPAISGQAPMKQVDREVDALSTMIVIRWVNALFHILTNTADTIERQADELIPPAHIIDLKNPNFANIPFGLKVTPPSAAPIINDSGMEGLDPKADLKNYTWNGVQVNNEKMVYILQFLEKQGKKVVTYDEILATYNHFLQIRGAAQRRSLIPVNKGAISGALGAIEKCFANTNTTVPFSRKKHSGEIHFSKNVDVVQTPVNIELLAPIIEEPTKVLTPRDAFLAQELDPSLFQSRDVGFTPLETETIAHMPGLDEDGRKILSYLLNNKNRKILPQQIIYETSIPLQDLPMHSIRISLILATYDHSLDIDDHGNLTLQSKTQS